jgi:DNA processing protein
MDYFGGAKQVWEADANKLLSTGLLDVKTCNNLLEHREKIDVQNLAEERARKGIQVCTIFDSEYPCLLRNIFNPPIILYYRGVLPVFEHNTIAVVGARRASAYGKNAAVMLAAALAEQGIWVISGAARGIDTAAHRGALKQGRTVAVLGCGVDVIYPPENGPLLNEIVQSGAVISEYPPGTPAHPGFFPARNRIISGLSLGTVVVEAAEKSGALITADFALEQGRDVFAVPGSIFSQQSKGTHNLIKQGAKIVGTVEDILEEYGLAENAAAAARSCLTGEEERICSVLNYEEPQGMEEIIMKSKLTPSVAAYLLLQLELRGLVAECGGQRYIRTAGEGIR